MSAAVRLDGAIQAQVRQVDRRVLGGAGTYAEERSEIRRAAAQVEALRTRLGLGEFVRSLSRSSGKPQLLLAFRSPSRGDVVVKVYGRVRPNEALVQGLWWRAGVPTVEVLEAGDEPVSWLLMPLVEGRPPDAEESGRAGLTCEVARAMAQAHRIGGARSGPPFGLLDAVGGHLRNVLAALARHGHEPPGGWWELAQQVYGKGIPTLLHGDLTPRNLLREPSGRLRFLDTCGYAGPAEFDAARWCARVGGSDDAAALLDLWLGVEPGLNAELAGRLLGLELLMEAGVRELVKEERHEDWQVPDARTRRCLTLGAKLLGLKVPR